MAAESLLVHGGVVNGYRVLFHLPWLVKFPVPQLWRLITPFLLTGNGFSALWDLYMFWTYATGLELNSPRFTQPGDFCTYVIFVATTILVSCPTLHIVHLHTSHNLPGQTIMSDTVPGNEGDYPYVSCRPSFAYHSRSVRGIGMVGAN